jgi:hypothetical protein
MWSEPDQTLLNASHGALYVCSYMGVNDLHVVEIGAIVTVVAMIPMKPSEGGNAASFFAVEKPGLDALVMGQQADEDVEEL